MKTSVLSKLGDPSLIPSLSLLSVFGGFPNFRFIWHFQSPLHDIKHELSLRVIEDSQSDGSPPACLGYLQYISEYICQPPKHVSD